MCQRFWNRFQSLNKGTGKLWHALQLMVCLFLVSNSFALNAYAQNTAAKATEAEASQTPEELLGEMETAISMRAHELLTQKVDDFLSRRLDKNNYRFDIVIKVNNESLQPVVSRLGAIEIDIFLKSLAESEYIAARRYLKSAKVTVTIADFVAAGEAKEILDGLKTALKGAAAGPESFDLKSAKFAPSALERSVLLQAKEAIRNTFDEIKAREKVDMGIEKMRQDFAKSQSTKREKEMEEQLSTTKKKKEELEQMFDSESLKAKLRRELPALFRSAALGSGFGVVALLAFAILMIGILVAATKLGQFFVEGSSEVASALKERGAQSGAQSGQPLVIQQAAGGSGAGSASQGDQFQFQQEVVVALKEVSLEIRAAVELDLSTATALISKHISANESVTAFAMFEILGPQLSQQLFNELPQPDKKILRQYFYSGASKNLNLAQIYTSALSFRSSLNSTSIVVGDKAEKAFAHLLLTHSNEELAAAFQEIPVEKSMKVLASLPAERAAQIMKASSKKTVVEWMSLIGEACQTRDNIDFEDVAMVKNAIIKPDRVKFDESKNYLKTLVSQLEEEVVDELLKGLQKFPTLLSAVSGNRATLDDLWAQPADLIFKLSNQLELRQTALLLYVSPNNVRQTVVDQFTGRKRERFDEEYARLQTMDEDERNKAISANAVARKKVLETLANMADTGKANLPSRTGGEPTAVKSAA